MIGRITRRAAVKAMAAVPYLFTILPAVGKHVVARLAFVVCAAFGIESGLAAAAAQDRTYTVTPQTLRAMEEASPFPLMQHRVGGKDGGATRLSPELLELMERFEQVRDQVNVEADRCFSECFREGVSKR